MGNRIFIFGKIKNITRSFKYKVSYVSIACRHGHGAEDAVAFASCHNADVIFCVLFELGSSVLGDHRTGGVCFDGGRLVPIPGAVRICCDENIVSVTL